MIHLAISLSVLDAARCISVLRERALGKAFQEKEPSPLALSARELAFFRYT